MMRAALDWTFRGVAFIVLVAVLWSDLWREPLPTLALLGVLMVIVCCATPNASDSER
jgi:ABC-type proline/glycine betaine transport system permease subunit